MVSLVPPSVGSGLVVDEGIDRIPTRQWRALVSSEHPAERQPFDDCRGQPNGAVVTLVDIHGHPPLGLTLSLTNLMVGPDEESVEIGVGKTVPDLFHRSSQVCLA